MGLAPGAPPQEQLRARDRLRDCLEKRWGGR